MREQRSEDADNNSYFEKNYPIDNFPKNKNFPPKKHFILKAKENKNEIFDLTIFNANNTDNINCGQLGEILDSFQKVIHALALGSKSKKNNVCEETRRKSNLFYSSTKLKPFTIRMVSGPEELIEKDETELYCKQFIEMLHYTNNPNGIVDNLQKYNNLTKVRFTIFIKNLVKNSFEINVRWTNKHGLYNDAESFFNCLTASLDKLQEHKTEDKNNFDYNGELVGINTENDFFAFIPDDGGIIRGKLSKALKRKKFNIPSLVKVTIDAQEEISKLTKKVLIKYELINIKSQ
ncbi:MAG: hypothetical protein KAG28_09765 [Cocleimonas sp.]|nr:hypothetical protein [Cocleimonas sp.]